MEGSKAARTKDSSIVQPVSKVLRNQESKLTHPYFKDFNEKFIAQSRFFHILESFRSPQLRMFFSRK